MSEFSGFPAKTRFTPIPDAFFSHLLPEMSDVAELKVTLHLFWLLYRKRGYPRFVTFSELLDDKLLKNSMTETVLQNALKMAVKRGTILHLPVGVKGVPEDAYFINTEAEQQTVARIKNGELILTGIKTGVVIPEINTEPLPDTFALYEENIGMLTPMIADELREAEKLYPKEWIRDAIKEAVSLNKRNWRYIVRILERWSSEGKSDGTYQRDSKEATNKYLKQKYGNIVKR